MCKKNWETTTSKINVPNIIFTQHCNEDKIKSSVGNTFDAVTVNEVSSHKTEGPVACEIVYRSFMYNMTFSNCREKETYKRQVQGTKLAYIQQEKGHSLLSEYWRSEFKDSKSTGRACQVGDI